MAQITENMVLDMLTACERNEHPSLTVWEAKQLLHAWREREALRKDAERYQWICNSDWDCFDSRWLSAHDVYGQGPDELNALIDAKMTEDPAVG